MRSSAPLCTTSCPRCSTLPLVAVFFGPGGVGKGTLVAQLVARDPRLWLSRSWTTRPRRPHEAEDAYVFVDRPAFEAAKARGAFLETNEFAANGHLYGTPWPDPPGDDLDVILEIDLNGAVAVKRQIPAAVAILVVPPSDEELVRRLRHRGDSPEQIERRLALAQEEVGEGRRLADHVLVNDDLAGAVDEAARILDGHRRTTPWEQ